MDFRKMLWTTGITLLIPALSFGQNEVNKNKGAIVETHADTLVIKKGDKNLRVKIYEEMVDGKQAHTEEIFSGVFVDHLDEEQNSFLDVLPFIPNKKRTSHFDANYPFFYFAFGRGGSGAMSYTSRYPEKSGKSIDWGFNIFNSEMQLDRQGHWGLTWAIGFAYSRHTFDTNAALEKMEDNVVWTPAPEDVDYQKSWLRYWSFRVPLSIEWQKNIKGSPLYFSAGPEVEIRFAMKSKVKFDGHEHTLCSNPNTNVLGANLMVQAGYGCLSFIGRFGLTPLMDKDRAPHFYHSSLGFGIHF